jgi:hypothetical protein
MSKKTATKQDVRAFLRAVDELNALAERGLHIYLANDTLCLMSGPSHDARFRPQRGNVIMSAIVSGASGGDW